MVLFFFCKQKTAYEMRISDWSSDVCSSDLAPLAFVLVLSFGINKLSTGAAQALFWVYAAVMGLSMSTIFLAFTASSIATTFFATAAAFLGLRSEEHTSELQSLMRISYAVFCLTTKNTHTHYTTHTPPKII